ncbi:MAG: DUF3108 domain-containing protein [Alphaproteobacteria bacterium]
MTMLRQTARQTLRSRAAACAGLLLAASAMSARAADAPLAAVSQAGQPGQIMELGYEVYLGGMHIFSLQVDMALRPGSYSVAAEGGTRGFIGWLYKWDLKVGAEGHDQAGEIRPRVYSAATDWQKNPRTMRLAFQSGGAYDVQRTPPPEPDPDDEIELPSRLPENIVDPLSLAVAATRALSENGKCEQTLPVFDGQRRYDLQIKDFGEAAIAQNRYSIYHGPATRCGFTMQRISGFSKKWRASRQWDEDSASPPTVWLAPIRAGLPPVPVRYEGAIALGNMVVHLTKAEVRTELAENAPR